MLENKSPPRRLSKLNSSKDSVLLEAPPKDPLLQLTPKQMLSVEILTKGYVHSFVDFFYLTHADEMESIEATPQTGEYLEESLTVRLRLYWRFYRKTVVK
jgi:hypothetical protein